ncbi:MAG: hypothetical protein FJ276_06670 [Planctomycetes bacterium]|nr:hypothetical protein [Planctomycetota bacterium]
MSGVDVDMLRGEITMQQVLDESRFRTTHGDGDQLRGPCPVHGSTSPHSRAFSVNLREGRSYWHKCKSHGKELELYAAVKDTTVYQAASESGSTGGNVGFSTSILTHLGRRLY